jgi:hypothetical protein
VSLDRTLWRSKLKKTRGLSPSFFNGPDFCKRARIRGCTFLLHHSRASGSRGYYRFVGWNEEIASELARVAASPRLSQWRVLRRCVIAASNSDAIRPTRPFCKQQDGASAPRYARANSKAKGSCSQGNSRGLLEPYGQSALRGRCESVGHRLIPTFGPLGHEPLRWWRCAYHRLIASIPPGSSAPDGHSG